MLPYSRRISYESFEVSIHPPFTPSVGGMNVIVTERSPVAVAVASVTGFANVSGPTHELLTGAVAEDVPFSLKGTTMYQYSPPAGTDVSM